MLGDVSARHVFLSSGPQLELRDFRVARGHPIIDSHPEKASNPQHFWQLKLSPNPWQNSIFWNGLDMQDKFSDMEVIYTQAVAIQEIREITRPGINGGKWRNRRRPYWVRKVDLGFSVESEGRRNAMIDEEHIAILQVRLF